MAHEKWVEAEGFYSQALRLAPLQMNLLSNLALSHIQEGRFAEACREFEKEVVNYPDYAAGHVYYGSSLYKLGRLDEAEAQFRHALDLSPGLAAAQHGLSEIEAARRRPH
jgi:tetratricopeptide (TPR) repeat protein